MQTNVQNNFHALLTKRKVWGQFQDYGIKARKVDFKSWQRRKSWGGGGISCAVNEWTMFPSWRRKAIWLQVVKFSHNNDDLYSGWSSCHSNVVRIFKGQSSLAQCLRQGIILRRLFQKARPFYNSWIFWFKLMKWFSVLLLST